MNLLLALSLAAPVAAAEPPPPPPVVEPQRAELPPSLERSYRSGVRQAQVGQGVFTAASVVSVAGAALVFGGVVAGDPEVYEVGYWTSLAGTGLGLAAIPVTVTGANRAAGALSRGGIPVQRGPGTWSLALLGLAGAGAAGAWVLAEREPVYSQLALYGSWVLASYSYDLAGHQLELARWAHDRPVLVGVAVVPGGLVVGGRL